MNKAYMLLISLGLASNIFANELESFKKGFSIGLETVDYQLKNEGYQPKVIQLDSPYIVTMNINNIPTSDILYFQHLLAKENINSLITKEFLLIDSFDRKPDAIELKRILESKYPVSLKVEELTNGKIETYPILFSKTFDNVITDVTSNLDITYVKKYETPLQIRLEKEKSSNTKKIKKTFKYFKLKNKAMIYKYDYKKDSINKCKNISGKCFQSDLFMEYNTYSKGTIFKKGGVYKTNEGELFQKVYNTNLFIDLADVAK